jgi:hypothetical protein
MLEVDEFRNTCFLIYYIFKADYILLLKSDDAFNSNHLLIEVIQMIWLAIILKLNLIQKSTYLHFFSILNLRIAFLLIINLNGYSSK